MYGFYDEVMRKFGNTEVWLKATALFDYLPLAAVVTDSKTLALHAGLSPHLENIDHLSSLNRVMEPGYDGTMCDLLWSDPDESTQGWSVSPRGAGYVFGGDVVEKFNHQNDLNLIARSHQLVMKGFSELFEGTLTTVWSAPNYTGRCGNLASILRLEENESREYVVFGAFIRDNHEASTPHQESNKESGELSHSPHGHHQHSHSAGGSAAGQHEYPDYFL